MWTGAIAKGTGDAGVSRGNDPSVSSVVGSAPFGQYATRLTQDE